MVHVFSVVERLHTNILFVAFCSNHELFLIAYFLKDHRNYVPKFHYCYKNIEKAVIVEWEGHIFED